MVPVKVELIVDLTVEPQQVVGLLFSAVPGLGWSLVSVMAPVAVGAFAGALAAALTAEFPGNDPT